MKIGVSSYSFSKLVKSGVISQLDVVAKAKEIGFDYVEFTELLTPEGISPEEYALKIRKECAKNDIGLCAYTIWADFINGSDGNIEAEIERLKGEVRIADILGVHFMRHDSTWGYPPEYKGQRSFDAALPALVKGCRAVTEYAEQFGIKTMVENHGYFCQDSTRVEKLINGVNNPNFGGLIDIGNFLCVDEDPAIAVGRLAPYALHVHIKDFHTKSGISLDPGDGWIRTRAGNYLKGTIVGHGEVPVKQCLKTLVNSGYNGIISIEFEGMEEPLSAIRLGYKNLKYYLESL